jgi:glucosamine kinase
MFYRHCVWSNLAGPYVVGVDAGGTHTRAAVVTLGGAVAGYGAGPGANYNSGGDAEAALGAALDTALDGIDPLRIAGGVFGIAGAGSAGRARAVEVSSLVWRAAGMRGRPLVVSDIVVGFAAGTLVRDGILVFAGTGAGAAVIKDGAIARRADGYGWLVGDDGSAVWIGCEAARAALRALDGRGEPTLLAEAVPRTMLGEAAEPLLTGAGPRWALPQAILKEVYGGPPARLGRLAPVVGETADAGDKVAARILDEAASWLLTAVDAVRPALGGQPGEPGVVVTGSLLHRGRVADAIRAGLRSRFGTEPVIAGDGALGAARLALRRLGMEA